MKAFEWTKGGTRAILMMVVMGSLVTLTACGPSQEEMEAAEADRRKQLISLYEEELGARDKMVNDAVAQLNEIEANMTVIREKEAFIAKSAKNDGTAAESPSARVVRDIQVINTLLDENQEKLASLNKQLRSRGIKIESLETRLDELSKSMEQKEMDIASLRNTLSEREYQIATLTTRLDSSSMEIAMKEGTIAQHETTIRQKEDEIHQAWFTLATMKELKEKGVVDKKGGVLGIGSAKVLKDDFNEDYFISVDSRTQTTFPVYANKAELLTPHDAGSYRMVREDDKIVRLEVTNPEEFWKASKYLVVAVN